MNKVLPSKPSGEGDWLWRLAERRTASGLFDVTQAEALFQRLQGRSLSDSPLLKRLLARGGASGEALIATGEMVLPQNRVAASASDEQGEADKARAPTGAGVGLSTASVLAVAAAASPAERVRELIDFAATRELPLAAPADSGRADGGAAQTAEARDGAKLASDPVAGLNTARSESTAATISGSTARAQPTSAPSFSTAIAQDLPLKAPARATSAIAVRTAAETLDAPLLTIDPRAGLSSPVAAAAARVAQGRRRPAVATSESLSGGLPALLDLPGLPPAPAFVPSASRQAPIPAARPVPADQMLTTPADADAAALPLVAATAQIRSVAPAEMVLPAPQAALIPPALAAMLSASSTAASLPRPDFTPPLAIAPQASLSSNSGPADPLREAWNPGAQPGPIPLRAPEPDIDDLTEKLTRRIHRRLAVENERRGLLRGRP